MSTVQMTAPPAAATTPRARTQQSTTTHRVPTPRGSSAAPVGRRRKPVATAFRNVGILLDTAARVLFLGRDGVKL